MINKKKHRTWGDFRYSGIEKSAEVACMQTMVQVVSKGQSVWTEKASHCCPVWGTIPVLKKRAGMSSQTVPTMGTQLRSTLKVDCDAGFCDGHN